ncbi:MAG: sucrase ferredoxin [Candidatus Nanopelagicales bacterium]
MTGVQDDWCSRQTTFAREPLAGSAPAAQMWVLIEQPGPWGHDALTDSHLDPSVGQRLRTWSSGQSIRLGTIRRPGHHADEHHTGEHQPPLERTVFLAQTRPSNTWLLEAKLSDPEALLNLDPWALVNADRPPSELPGRLIERVLLVCTNAKRDRCCAVAGRQLVADMADDYPDSVWETSHLGGHRFAPTLVSLPDGYLFGGPDAGQLSVAACRGRSSLPDEAQAAELAALRHWDITHPTPLTVDKLGDGRFQVASSDAIQGSRASLTVTVNWVPAERPRPKSCGVATTEWLQLTTEVSL